MGIIDRLFGRKQRESQGGAEQRSGLPESARSHWEHIVREHNDKVHQYNQMLERARKGGEAAYRQVRSRLQHEYGNLEHNYKRLDRQRKEYQKQASDSQRRTFRDGQIDRPRRA